MYNLLLLGAPGAGKGTQAVRLKAKYNIPHISTGDIFRENIKGGTELGKRAKGYMDKGELVPDDLVIEIVKSRLRESDCDRGFLLDGFPRTVYQAEALSEFLSGAGKQIDLAIDVAVDRDVLVSRLTGRRTCRSCGAVYHVTNMRPKKEGLCDECGGELIQRADDTEETVSNRIEVYEIQTKPLIEYYESKGKIAHIDGAADSGEVYEKIVESIEA